MTSCPSAFNVMRDMKKFLIFYLLVLVSLSHAYAQDAGATYKKANQQYVLFESERDKGTNAAGMYTYSSFASTQIM